jgi:protein tyrosine/serine phosphatase
MITIPNFKEFSPGLYRGGQPSPDGWLSLKELGIKTVVKLNFPYEGSDEEAIKLGMTVVDCYGPPSGLINIFEHPDPDRIRLAVQTLGNKTEQPIYVHCLHGQDRTGLVVGLYRVLYEGFTKKEAFREMFQNGFHWEFLGLLDFWEDFDGKGF